MGMLIMILMIIEKIPNSAVTGRAASIDGRMGWFPINEFPKLPCVTILLIHLPYWT